MTGQSVKDYTFSRVLGEGGMATVYLAFNNKFRTDVAIKVLNKEFVYNTNVRNRFISEARNMFRMSHPNIVKVTDLIEEDDMVAFVMEYVDGMTLKEWLEDKSLLKTAEIRHLFSQILEAVKYVHEQGLIHRDIKPSNFIINRKGKLSLLDFGISKNTDSTVAEYTQTATAQNMGTPMYMSPEQVRDPGKVVAESDIYSLGVVLWQLVAGKKPYNASTQSTFDIHTKIVNDPLPLTHTAWDSIIQKATRKSPVERYRTAGEMLGAINQLSEGLEKRVKRSDFESTVIASSSPSYSEPLTKQAGKSRTGIMFLISSLIIAGAVITFLIVSGKNKKERDTGLVKSDSSISPVDTTNHTSPPARQKPNIARISPAEEDNVRNTVRDFYDAENAGNTDLLMTFYDFPLTRYYQDRNKTYNQLYNDVNKAFGSYLYFHDMQIDWSSFVSEKVPGGYRCNFKCVYGSGSQYQRPSYVNQHLGIDLNNNYQIKAVYKY